MVPSEAFAQTDVEVDRSLVVATGAAETQVVKDSVSRRITVVAVITAPLVGNCAIKML
jgi:hypothetical protein